MKIIKKGINPAHKPTRKTCGKCGCVFEYTRADMQSDRDGAYVVCPTEGCRSFISV